MKVFPRRNPLRDAPERLKGASLRFEHAHELTLLVSTLAFNTRILTATVISISTEIIQVGRRDVVQTNPVNSQMDPSDWSAVEVTGTIHVAVQIGDAVVMASDSRSSGRSFVANPVSDKLWQVTPRLFFGRCGTTSHTQFLTRLSRYVMNVVQADSPRPHPKAVSIAASYVSQILQANRDELSGTFVIGGWDDDAGPQLYSIAPSGLLLRRKFILTGSGSSYANSLCDITYREDFDIAGATAFVIKAVSHAITRDGSCGGVINVLQITADGTKRFTVKPRAQPVNETMICT
jgi:20S proteasome subunit beta 1